MKSMRAALAVGAVVLLTALGACSGDDEDTAPAPDTETKSDSFVEISDQQGTLEGFVGAVDDATVDRCESDGGELKVSGEVTNPESAAQQYRIYVSAMDDGETLGLVQVDIASVDAGATETWETTMALTEDDLDCILRVERADL